MINRNHLARNCLIAALVLVFGMFGIDKFIHPLLWIGWIPPALDGLLFPKEIWLRIIGSLEIATAILIAIPRTKARKIGTTLAILQLLGILSQVGWNDMGIRDAAILLSAVALILLL